MTNSGTTQKARSRQNRLFILLLILAALSGVVKDLERLQAVTKSIHGLTASWLEVSSTVHASGIPTAPACPLAAGQESKTETFRWNGAMGAGQVIEIKGINGDITAEPAAGNEMEVVATKKGRRNDPTAVVIKVVPHAKGITICAVYPNDPGDEPNTCEPGTSRDHSHVHNNDVSVRFRVRVPVGVEFIGRTVNGEISATSLTGNVDSRTVNGSINISTTGYAQATTVNGEITAKMGSANWSDSLEFKTVNGGIDIDLPAALSTQIQADTFNGDIDSEFPLMATGRISRKHVSGTIGGGGRELLLKTLNGSIRLRRVN